jgi:uncharacterized protein YciI
MIGNRGGFVMHPLKRIVVLIAFFASAAMAPAGDSPPAPIPPPARATAQFLVRMRPAHPDAQAGEEDKARIVQHFEYWKDLQGRGKLILAGVATDDASEIAILEVGDPVEAERLVAGDPGVRGNVYLAELHPFRITLAGGHR